LKAPSAQYLGDATEGCLEHMCQTAIDGRRAARTLTQWAERFELSESELQIVRSLSTTAGPGVDQTTLATGLALSPPQVSACVERLCRRGLIALRESQGDRRRRMWQLTAHGIAVLQEVEMAAGESREAAA
jgi:DNA-binding MarR family transcriptional regulator